MIIILNSKLLLNAKSKRNIFCYYLIYFYFVVRNFSVSGRINAIDDANKQLEKIFTWNHIFSFLV